MAPAVSPLPAGEGWVREKRPAPPTKSPPFAEPNEKPPFRKRGVGGIRPTVIPACAGIQNPGGGQCRARAMDIAGQRKAASRQPSPSGRGLGEGESFCANQRKAPFRRTQRKAPLSQKGGWGDSEGSWGDNPPTTYILDAGRSLMLGASIPPTPLLRKGGGGLRHHPGHRCPPLSFPRKRESTPRPIATPGLTGVLDSGLRRNDG